MLAANNRLLAFDEATLLVLYAATTALTLVVLGCSRQNRKNVVKKKSFEREDASPQRVASLPSERSRFRRLLAPSQLLVAPANWDESSQVSECLLSSGVCARMSILVGNDKHKSERRAIGGGGARRVAAGQRRSKRFLVANAACARRESPFANVGAAIAAAS